MALRGTDPESYITEYTLVYEEYSQVLSRPETISHPRLEGGADLSPTQMCFHVYLIRAGFAPGCSLSTKFELKSHTQWAWKDTSPSNRVEMSLTIARYKINNCSVQKHHVITMLLYRTIVNK